MAFRKHNPNVLSPIFSDDSTWSTVACSKNKARPAASKENYGIPPQDLGTMLTDYGTDAEHTTPSNERTSWRHSNGSIVLREAFPKPARLANDFCASGTQRGFPHINNDGDSYQNKINEAWSGVESSNTTLHSPSSTSKVIQRPSNFACTAVVPRKEGENSSHRSKLMAWSEVESSNTALQSPSYASKVIQRPSPSSYSTRTALVPRKDCENRNHRATEIALIKPPPGMIRVVPRPNAFNMETLKPSLPVTLKVPTHVKMQSLAAPPNISSANKIMDYSAAARSFIPTPKAKKTIPTFPIYADRDLGLQPKLQTPPPALDSVEKYGRQLYNLSESAEPGSAEQAESILRTMIVNYMKGEHHIQPDGACYNSVIHAYATAGFAHKAEAVMRLMFKDYHNGNTTAEPNVRCLTNLLHAWRKSQDPEAPKKCEALLEEMYELSDTGNLPNCKPDTFAVTVLLHCWAESDYEDAAERAKVHFKQMKARFLEGDESMRPDCISYSILLNTYAQKLQIKEAEEMLWEMVDDFLGGNAAAQPRTRNFNTILAMHARSNILEAPDRAERVVSRFRELADNGALQISPDEYTYSLLLKTWTTSGRPDGIAQAVLCFEWMRDLNAAGDAAACPDIVKYTTIISAYARNGDHTRAEELLNVMIDDFLNGNKRAKPDSQLFDTVISACTGGRTNCPTSIIKAADAFRAESVLRRMWSLHETGQLVGVRPQGTTYKYVIIGYKKSGNPCRAEELLWEMERKSVAKAHKQLFQTVLNAWHESHHHDKQRKLNTLRLVMNDRFGPKSNSGNGKYGSSKRYQ